MSDSAFICPQCDLEIELSRRPSPPKDESGVVADAQVIAVQCERCVAWIRVEGWSCWCATHYTMTPFRDAIDALQAFPKGVWLAAANATSGD